MPRKSTSTGKPKQLSVREKAGVYRATQPLPRIEQFDLLAPDQLKEITTFASVANQGYAIYICNTPKLREDLIVGLTDNLKAEGVGLYQVRLRSEDKSLGAKIRILLQNEEFSQFRKKYQKVVLTIVGIDETIQEAEKKFEKRPAALQSLNQQRDYLRTLPFPLLIWVPEWLAAKLPEFAPDFWVARSVVFECLTPSEMMKQSLSQLSGVEVTFKDLSEAKRKMRIYEKLIKSSEDMFIRASALLNLGILKQDVGNYSEAGKLYRESLKIGRDLGDKLIISSNLHQLGNIKFLTSNYPEAEKLYRESLKIAEELDDKLVITRSLHQLGSIKWLTGNYSEAEKLYSESLKIAECLGDESHIAKTLHELGIIKQHTDKYSEAEELYHQSLRIKEKVGDKSGIAKSLHQLGMIKLDMGNYSEAEKLYRESLKIAEELGDKLSVAMTLHELGIIKQQTGNYSEAERLYRESLKIKDELGHKSGIASSLGQLGRLAEIRGDDEKALKNYLASLTILQQLKSPDAEINKHDIARIKERIGETKFQEICQKIQSNR